MKATELRIGNLVNAELASGNVINHTITALNILRISENDSVFKFEPIPLTEDWLVKFGFEKDSRSGNVYQVYYYGLNPETYDHLIIIKNTGKGFFYSNAYNKINYVHQLQNLFHTLTGEELTIKP